ncbi:MAG: serine hydrolase, partial [Bacteroidales bacterium]|nr:serine hydrolase [Bacteroidales bacterium]
MIILKRVLVSLVAIFTCAVVLAQPLQRVVPEKAGMDPVRLSNVDKIIESSIEKGEIPGAVLAVVRDGKMVYLKSYGNKRVYPTVEKMDINTIFDLASVSKPVGCAISIMQLVEQGRMRLTDNVSMYIDGFKGYQDPETGRTIDIRIVDLLTHSSGLPPYAPAADLVTKYGSPAPEGLMEYISNCKRDFKPTTKFQYSCLNFITLQNILQNITGMKLEEYTKKYVFDVLGMKNSTFNPSKELYPMIAPTEKLQDGSVILGKVHDPLARLLNGGNSGNAGVFSNADDLAILAAALMNGGEYNGKRVLGSLTTETMTRVPSDLSSIGRSLGWDNYSSYASNNGNLFHPGKTFGHTGYTGTSFIVDPVSKTAVILLANRVHPEDKGSVVRLRALVANAVAGSV